ncbi:hypothetical protein [Peptoniphilus obesi]|uniref:hypothetical protein n=1 Tax=Peptoniphilus obesi TaxID=1472765 RepID=UPI0004B39DED|nr:hypothetical protein [Peptoniphilus obesi]
MEELLVLYDKDIEDKDRDLYLKSIEKNITNASIYDVDDIPNLIADKLLLLKPMENDIYNKLSQLLKYNPKLDIEGSHSGGLSITAEAVLKKLKDIKGKTIVILNQSNILGKSLASELVKLGASVFSLNSNFKSINNLLRDIDIDILISASGDKNFKIENKYLKNIDTLIDLSDDLESENKITRVDTVKVLRSRLK